MGCPRIGIHTSIAGSVAQAAARAAQLGANTFQIFSGNPRSWGSRLLNAREVVELKETRRRYNLAPMVVHDSYLINMAAADERLRMMSAAAFSIEISRALTLGAEYLVFHPGSYKGQRLEEGIERLVRSLLMAATRRGRRRLTLLLENTAGSGSAIGSRFEELAEIRKRVQRQIGFRVGYCLDTAHCLAAGYDVSSEEGLEDTLRQAEKVLGLDRVPVIHANDSKAPLGSRVDRHEHIGRGHIGLRGFRRIVNHPKLREKVFILETPIDREGDDRRNLQRLKKLCEPGFR